MSDLSRQDATRPDDVHTMTLKQLEEKILQAGILISRRQLMRHCKSGTFDAQKLPARNNVEEWFIAPASVEKGIADIRALRDQRERHDVIRRVASETGHKDFEDAAIARHAASSPDASGSQQPKEGSATEPDTSRYVAVLERENDFLRAQVGKKDEQIADLSMRFGNLSDRFADTQKLLGAMQRMLAPLLGQGDPFNAPPEKREVEESGLSTGT